MYDRQPMAAGKQDLDVELERLFELDEARGAGR